jgi:hypothetical protein
MQARGKANDDHVNPDPPTINPRTLIAARRLPHSCLCCNWLNEFMNDCRIPTNHQSNIANPSPPEEEFEDVGDEPAKDVFETQTVKDAVW